MLAPPRTAATATAGDGEDASGGGGDPGDASGAASPAPSPGPAGGAEKRSDASGDAAAPIGALPRRLLHPLPSERSTTPDHEDCTTDEEYQQGSFLACSVLEGVLRCCSPPPAPLLLTPPLSPSAFSCVSFHAAPVADTATPSHQDVGGAGRWTTGPFPRCRCYPPFTMACVTGSSPRNQAIR